MGKYTSEEFVPGEKYLDTLKKTVNSITSLKSAMGIQDKGDESKKGPAPSNMFGSLLGSVGLGVK